MTPSTERNKATRQRRKDKGMVEVRVWLSPEAVRHVRAYGVATDVQNPTPSNVLKDWAEGFVRASGEPPF